MADSGAFWLLGKPWEAWGRGATIMLKGFLRKTINDLLKEYKFLYGRGKMCSGDALEGKQTTRIPSVDWSWLPVIELTDDECAMAEHLNQTLGRGEAACIALAKSRQWIMVTDDRDARRAAREAGLIISGTLGALMNLVRGKALSLAEADKFLAIMKRSGYRCPVNSLSELDTG